MVEGKQPEAIPAENTVVIPRLQLQQTIHENKNPQWGLAKGVWHDPHSSAPDQGKNTVLTGHRFTYAGAAVFYHLDKVQPDDPIVVYWNKKKYTYKVHSIKVAPPTDSSVVAQTDDHTLTIYTCTPLITAKNRLIIIAKPLEETP
jgi:sortase A